MRTNVEKYYLFPNCSLLLPLQSMLKQLFTQIIKQYLFWMIFFFICRSIFLLYNLTEIDTIAFGEIVSAFWHGLYLDTSFACYFLGFSFVIFCLYAFIPKKIFHTVHLVYVLLLLVLFSLVTIAELEIYHEWGSKLTVKALRFLQNPSEVFHSTSVGFLIFGFIAVGVLTYAGYFLLKKINPFPSFGNDAQALSSGERAGRAVAFIFITPVWIVVGIRGGFQQIPIQQSDAYFSKHNILNLAAVNSGWNLGQSIWENKKNMEGNPYMYFSAEEAKKTVQEIYRIEKDTTVSILKTNRPNIVMVILESWSADLIKSLGGYESVTPGMDKLIEEGVVFENAYASGSLSDQGMAAIFSAFPAQPTVSIITQPGKYVKLPCLNTELKQAGYTTSFLFGGQLSYGNIKAYMYYNNFDRILEGSDFGDEIPIGRLGVHDEYLYERQLTELKNEKQPFFAAMFTLSSHNPFDMPMAEKDKLPWEGPEAKYVNSVRYADAKLYEFLQNAKKEKWFDNTLFVFVSDHSHRSPKYWAMNQPEYRKIPMVLWGNVIKDEFKGYKSKKICSQIDIASTLFHQLQIPADRFKWSKNLFNPYTPEFAYFETSDGFGWVRPALPEGKGASPLRGDGSGASYLAYSHPMNRYYFEKTNSPEEKNRLEKEGKSYLQVMFQEYTDY